MQGQAAIHTLVGHLSCNDFYSITWRNSPAVREYICMQKAALTHINTAAVEYVSSGILSRAWLNGGWCFRRWWRGTHYKAKNSILCFRSSNKKKRPPVIMQDNIQPPRALPLWLMIGLTHLKLFLSQSSYLTWCGAFKRGGEQAWTWSVWQPSSLTRANRER